MAEDTQVAEPVEAPVEQKPEQKEEKKPALDPNRPLSQQVDKIMANMPEEKDEPAKLEEESKADEENKEEEVIANQIPSVPEEDEDEPTTITPPEGTWQEYVLKGLQSFTVHILDAKGTPKTLNIKTPQELPQGYSWPNSGEQDTFHIAVKAQDDRAKELMAEFNQKEQMAKYQEFQAQEAVDIQEDIQALQKDGLLPKFQYKEDDPKFNTDPAVKEANEIYDIYKKTNEGYMKKYANSNRTFRISYRDAADKYYAQKARTPKDETPAKQEREQVASKVSAPQSANPSDAKKTMPAGSTMQDVLKLYKLGRL